MRSRGQAGRGRCVRSKEWRLIAAGKVSDSLGKKEEAVV